MGVVRERRAFRHLDLERDEIDAEDRLRHRVFDLEAGVHLQEVGLAVGDQELDRSRAHVVDGSGGPHGQVVEGFREVAETGGRGLLDDLLMAALEGAVAGAERPDRAVRVGEDLHFHMPTALYVGLDEDLAVSEGAEGLGAGGAQLGVEGVELAYDAHTASAAARGRLDEHREIGGGDRLQRFEPHQFLGARLGGHRLDGLGRRPDPDEARVEDGPREAGVLGEEAVPGVHGVRARAQGGLHDQVAAQIRVRGRRPRQPYRLVGHTRVEGVLVGVRVHGDGPDPQLTAGAEDPAGDLAPIGHEDRSNHWDLTSGRRRSHRAHPHRGPCGSRTGTGRERCGCRGGR